MKLWRGQPDNWAWKPTTREIAYMWLGLGAMFAVLAAYEFWRPTAVRTGRWSWLFDMAIAVFGFRGVFVLFTIISAAFLFFGVRKYWSSRTEKLAEHKRGAPSFPS